MEFGTLTLTTPEPGIGLLTLNRPEKLNAINLDMLEELHAVYEHLCADIETRVVILTGAGRGFCSGADLTDERMLREAPVLYQDPTTFLTMVQKKYSQPMLELRRMPQPVIAAVNGAAAGGGMALALASDIIYASENARFIPSFINIGLSGGELGTTYFLPRQVGSARAAEILYTGRNVSAVEAERIGLVTRVVAAGDLLPTAMETARVMISKSPAGLRQTKEALDRNLTAPSLENAIEFENRNQALCAFAGAFKAAIEAFAVRKKED